MKLLSIEHYRDGGSIKLITDKGTFFKNKRLFTDNPDRVFNDWPSNGGQIVDENTENYINGLLQAYELGFDIGEKYGVSRITKRI